MPCAFDGSVRKGDSVAYRHDTEIRRMRFCCRGGKRANRTDVNDGENSSRNCSLLDDPQETKSRLASIRDGIETEIEQSVLRMVGQNKISFDIQAAAVDYGTNDLRSGRASLAAGARETTRVVPTEELLEDPGSRNAGRAASLPGKDLETGPLIPAARGDKSDGHFAPSAPHEHRSISKTSQQPLRRLQSIWGSRVLVSGPRWSSWFSKVSEVESEHMKAIYAMRHPHVVAVMGVTRCPDNSVGLVIERLEQGSLYNLVHNPMIFFDNAAMFGITQNIVQGMTYMHLAQPPVIHRLLKASNVVVDSKFTAKVSDFGLADLIGDADIVSSSAAALWMAPEVLCGEACTTASDVYSFGITLYELWTRCDPYAGEEVNAVVRDVARPPPSAMRVIWKRPVLPEGHQVPQRVISLMEDCWHQDPARRPSFQAIAGTLRNIEEEVIKQNQRQFGQDRQLLEQILPPHVAELLREGKEVPPEKHDMVTLLFTDIVGFTDISSTLKPEQASQDSGARAELALEA